MNREDIGSVPAHCPVCGGELLVTRLECAACHTEVNGTFTLGHLAGLREPHASLIDMFLRVRGNVKEMERELGLSYPTVRARLEEALEAAGYARGDQRAEHRASPPPWDPQFEIDLSERIRRSVEESLGRVHGLGRTEYTRRQTRDDSELAERRAEILGKLERGELSAAEAAAQLRDLKKRR